MLYHSRTRLCSMHLWGNSQNSRQQQCTFGHGTTNSKRTVVCAGKKNLDDQKHQKRLSCVFLKKIWHRRKEIVTKNESGNPHSTTNRLAHPEKTFDNETLQATTRSGRNGRGQAKAQTELAYTVSQAERILNMYEIHISLNFLFKFWGIIFMLFNIKAV